jgi:hypothetical protein
MNRWKDTIEFLVCAMVGLLIGLVIFETIMEEILL